MDKIYICQHLGLGDHIVTNAAIRKMNKELHKILCVREHNLESVKFMLKDVPNLSYRIVKDEHTMMQEMAEENNTVFNLGLILNKTEYFNKCYYDQCNLPMTARWEGFHVERNYTRETDIYEYYNLHKDEEYIFLHEDQQRNFVIKRNYLPPNIRVIEPKTSITNNIFDYLTIIEKAKELHVISSCFMFLIDSVKTFNKLFMHHYARTEPCYMQPLLKREWLIINN